MRARFELPLATLILLFLLQSLAALVATLFTLVYDAVFDGRQSAWLQMLLPIAALAAPALPLARRFGREQLLAVAAGVAALARIALCFPSFTARWIASAIVVAAAAIFLSAAVGMFDRRAVTAGAAAAILIEQLLRFAGWSWDVLLRPGSPMLAQVVLSALAAVLAAIWLLQPGEISEGAPALERRMGGIRLRGAVVLGCTLFLELTLLARPAVVTRWTGVPYPVVALALIAVSAGAVIGLALQTLPTRHYRLITTGWAAAAGLMAVLGPRVGNTAGAVLLVAGHAAALALLAPALTPGGGNRKGWAMSIMPTVLLILAAVYGLTFFAAFTVPALHDRGPIVIAAAAILLVLATLVLPRPLPPPPLDPRPATGLAVLALLAAAMLAIRTAPRPTTYTARNATLDVATFNVHLGFTQDWRFDPRLIAGTISASGADIVALQEAPAGLMIAYGVDLPLWLGHQLGMHALFAPSKGGLLGDALLTRYRISSWTSSPLPRLGGDPRQLLQAVIPVDGVPLTVAGAHFGLTETRRRAQAAAVVDRLDAAPRAVLLGDINADAGSATAAILRAAGFRDAFEISGDAPAPTWPTPEPTQRIDWIWVRGYDVSVAGTSAGGGSDHRLVGATLVVPTVHAGRRSDRDP